MTIKQYYTTEQYNERIGSGFRSKLFRQSHLLMEKYNFGTVDKILEIGGGSIPHINFIKHKFNSYYSLEVDCGAKIDLYINKNYPKIIFNYYDGKNIQFNEGFFDRIVISHCLEHILEPEKFINEMLRVLKKGGVISIALPCDPGILWRIGRLLLKTNRRIKEKFFLQKNIEVSDYINATEHVNSIFNLYAIIKEKFNVKKEICYPFNVKLFDLNLFYICQIEKQ
jgi:ubiquinone/menaquinone biosynthesis C-methylase UbiE